MKDYGISTAALILSFVTALPPFPLELCVQNCFGLNYITSIFSCEHFWFLGRVGPVFPVRTECGDFTSVACETFLRGVPRLFWRDASQMFLVYVSSLNCRVMVDTLLQSLFRRKLTLISVMNPRPKPAGLPYRSGRDPCLYRALDDTMR